jgi:beta-N-acetylhexosaminidase
MALDRPLGPVIVDVAGLELAPDDRELLAHPLVGGVILFARNYAAPGQLRALTSAIGGMRSPSLLIAVDQEGGRVQRFGDGFTRLPPMRALGRIYDANPALAKNLAGAVGVVLASELAAHGVDLSFAPVLDIDFGSSSVIGDRAFHAQATAVAQLAAALTAGMRRVGMGAVGKHFPGHGYVRADSHHEVPVDERDLATIEANDLAPYRALIDSRALAGVMPAHVVYPRIDSRPAGFSPIWLRDILRGRLGFDGIVFSDDLSMEGASVAGGIVDRGHAALAAGCDMVLVCNAREAAVRLLDGLGPATLDPGRAERMRGPRPGASPDGAGYRLALAEIAREREGGGFA